MAKIMIVDDSTIMRKKIRKYFDTMGHEVIAEACDGMDAYRKYMVNRPDLVTMDISMPVLSGLEAVDKILEKDPGAKIIMVSAIGQKPTVLEALKKGAKHYILKPIDPVQLMSVVIKVLNSGSGK